MENIENTYQKEDPIITNGEIRDYLLECSKWGKFLSIVGFIGIGLIISFSLIISLSTFSYMPHLNYPNTLLVILYLFIALVYLLPLIYLYNFSTQMKQGLMSNKNITIISGFKNLKSLFKFMGIFTIVILSIYAVLLAIILPLSLL